MFMATLTKWKCDVILNKQTELYKPIIKVINQITNIDYIWQGN